MYTFIESPLFGRLIHNYLNDEEYADLQWHMAEAPDAGDIIRGSSGIRKLRWAAKGKGKRGGVRVIYYWHDGAMKYGSSHSMLKTRRMLYSGSGAEKDTGTVRLG